MGPDKSHTFVISTQTPRPAAGQIKHLSSLKSREKPDQLSVVVFLSTASRDAANHLPASLFSFYLRDNHGTAHSPLTTVLYYFCSVAQASTTQRLRCQHSHLPRLALMCGFCFSGNKTEKSIPVKAQTPSSVQLANLTPGMVYKLWVFPIWSSPSEHSYITFTTSSGERGCVSAACHCVPAGGTGMVAGGGRAQPCPSLRATQASSLHCTKGKRKGLYQGEEHVHAPRGTAHGLGTAPQPRMVRAMALRLGERQGMFPRQLCI